MVADAAEKAYSKSQNAKSSTSIRKKFVLPTNVFSCDSKSWPPNAKA